MTTASRDRASARSARASESDEGQLRLAVLIDADNAQATVIEQLLAEVARYGDATVRRIYGDFTSPHSASWKRVLQRNAIKPVQQFAYSTGKNATDSTLIIDAMDLLYTGNFDGFCLVTSDSDFTGLAMRLREEGLTVLGFGERKTPEAFRNACHRFVFVEVLREAASGVAPAPEGPEADQRAEALPSAEASQEPRGAATAARPKLPKKFVLSALAQSVDDEGWAHVGTFGSYLNKLQPDFDPRLYGYRKLSDLIRARTDLFVTEERRAPGANQSALYLRAR
ncbi:MAG: NYN domain-containing protein [Candidatus Nanopelagicales bacterium]|nr:NYN domain-containing protein [Candidatus Nanopelagicales bacterium]